MNEMKFLQDAQPFEILKPYFIPAIYHRIIEGRKKVYQLSISIEGIEKYPDNYLRIYNRWGTLVFEEKGYSLGVDWPYSGTIVPMAFYQKNPNVYSIMLEINRGLYLMEPGNEKSEQFTAIQQVVQDFLKMLKNNY
jgi:hypothetical protein